MYMHVQWIPGLPLPCPSEGLGSRQGSPRPANCEERYSTTHKNSYADIKHIHVHLTLTLSLWSFSHDNNSSLLHTVKINIHLCYLSQWSL